MIWGKRGIPKGSFGLYFCTNRYSYYSDISLIHVSIFPEQWLQCVALSPLENNCVIQHLYACLASWWANTIAHLLCVFTCTTSCLTRLSGRKEHLSSINSGKNRSRTTMWSAALRWLKWVTAHSYEVQHIKVNSVDQIESRNMNIQT